MNIRAAGSRRNPWRRHTLMTVKNLPHVRAIHSNPQIDCVRDVSCGVAVCEIACQLLILMGQWENRDIHSQCLPRMLHKLVQQKRATEMTLKEPSTSHRCRTSA